MPSRDQHLQKARQNEAAALVIANTAHKDWEVTMLFYAALHYVEAYFATGAIHGTSHSQRDRLVANSSALSPIFADYMELKAQSRSARYWAVTFDEETIRRKIRPALESFKRHLERLP